MQIKRIKLSKVRNIRTLSQYKTIDGKSIRENSLIRSSRLDKMNKKKRDKFLSDYDISTVIDLRTETEVNEGNDLVYPDFVKYYHISFLSQAFFGISHEKKMRSTLYKVSKDMSETYMIDMYKSIVFSLESQQKIREFFDVIMDDNSTNILYHCTGGKDRTGIASLFLLTILGVPKEVIIEDYCMSDICNKRHNTTLKILMMLLLHKKKFRKLLILMLYAKKEYLESTISAIEEKYGSILGYIEEVLLIDKEKQELIRNKFLVK
ncbi:MAG: tyrosine-protein phosphatase [Acholeplasmatales bacterium]|nr:tyrosine-protein phosphatase [Acholeplasmatales bacterium]